MMDAVQAELAKRVTDAYHEKRKRSWKTITVDEIVRGFREVQAVVKWHWSMLNDRQEYERAAIAQLQESYDEVLRVHRVSPNRHGEYSYAGVVRDNDGG